MIGISKTKEQSDKGFLSNVGIPSYNIHSQPTNSFAGGVALYIKSTLDNKMRDDICMTKDEFEIICLEILSKKDKHTLCCCVYRHPNTDGQAILDFINNTMQKIIKERKKHMICFMGDFNLNLLNYETHDDTNDFLNSMISYSLLPYSTGRSQHNSHFAKTNQNEVVRIHKNEVTTSFSICENEFVILNSWSRNHKFCSHPRTILGQTTAIPTENALSFQNNLNEHVISLGRGDFKLSIGSLNNKFPYMVEGLLNNLQSAQHGGKWK